MENVKVLDGFYYLYNAGQFEAWYLEKAKRAPEFGAVYRDLIKTAEETGAESYELKSEETKSGAPACFSFSVSYEFAGDDVKKMIFTF